MSRTRAYTQGVSAYEAGRYRDAIAHLAPLLSTGQSATAILSRFYLGQAHYHLAVELFERRRYRDAADHFKSASTVNPSGGSFARFLAECYAHLGRLDVAADHWEVVLREQPDNIDARIRLALARWKQGQPIEAIAALREGLMIAPDHPELTYQLGVCLAADGDLADAERLFEKTVALDPEHAGAYERLAQCCGADQRAGAALLHLKKAQRLDPANPRIAWQLALLAGDLARTGHEPEVQLRRPAEPRPLRDDDLDALGELVVRDPDFLDAFLSLPESQVDREVFTALAATLHRALEKHPEFADLHYHAGRIHRRLGQTAVAAGHAEQAVAIHPKFTSALILLARLYAETDRSADAIGRLERAVDAGGDYPDVHYLMGRLYQQRGDARQARRAFERALDLNAAFDAARNALEALPA